MCGPAGSPCGGDFMELQIRGKVKDNEIDVVFRQTATPLRPGNGYIFLDGTDTFQGWFNAFPSATAAGHVIIGGETIEINGVGYHDHNYGNVTDRRGVQGLVLGAALVRAIHDPSPSKSRTVRDSEGGRCRCSGSTTQRRRRSSCVRSVLKS